MVAVTEHPFGGRIELQDLALLVHNDGGIQGYLKHGAAFGLQPRELLRPAARSPRPEFPTGGS